MAKNFKQEGDTLTLTPAADVASGAGYLFGTALFGVALTNVASGTPGPFATEGVFELGKTSALAIAVGDRLYWDATNKRLTTTASGNTLYGHALTTKAAAAGPLTVRIAN
jgi:predicted RecA/RadA family phage recombinase